VSDRDDERLERLAQLESLSDTLAGRDAGELFASDLEEAKALAAADPRFEPLVRGLAEPRLGARMKAIDRFFASLDPAELAALPLPPNLAQLRQIYLTSRLGEA
jgi:hypothetical protein